MEAIQLFQRLIWKYVTCEKNCPLDKAEEDTSPSGNRHISRKARGWKKCSTDILFLFWEPIQNPTLHVLITSPQFPLIWSCFTISPYFRRVTGQGFSREALSLYLSGIIILLLKRTSQKQSVHFIMRKYQILNLFVSPTIFLLSNSRIQFCL